MTKDEMNARIDAALAVFKAETTYINDLLQSNWKDRAMDLAQKDVDLLFDTRAASSYLVTRVYRHPKLLLTGEMDAYLLYLSRLNDDLKKQTDRRTSANGSPMLSIVDMEDLFGKTEDLLQFAMASFDPSQYNPSKPRKGFFRF